MYTECDPGKPGPILNALHKLVGYSDKYVNE